VIQITLIDLDDLRLLQAGAIRHVLERLPHEIAARIVELVLHDHQPALLVQRQHVEAFARVREAVELLLDDREFFAQRIGHTHEPILKMLALAQIQSGEAPFLETHEPIPRNITMEHPSSLVLPDQVARASQSAPRPHQS